MLLRLNNKIALMKTACHFKVFLASFILTLSISMADAQHHIAKQPWRLKSNSSGKNYKDDFQNTDLSKLFTQTEDQDVYGFIGDKYQRIRIKFILVKKDTSTAGQYLVYGKSMVKNNIDGFLGKLIIKRIEKSPTISWGVDDSYKNKGIKGQYMIYGEYQFDEDQTQKHSGTFKGAFQTDFYVNRKGLPKYDDIEEYSDSFTNNQFRGTWASYDGKLTQRCNWGDYRVPDSGDLDIGAGDFSPNGKYVQNGWQDERDRYKLGDKYKPAKWWK